VSDHTAVAGEGGALHPALFRRRPPGGHLGRSLQLHHQPPPARRRNRSAHRGFIADLKRTGLWEETLLVWGGEFGRTPTSEGVGKPGRDHNPHGFTMWLAGASVKGGQAVGATDELGFRAVEGRRHVADLHATILHLMGLDHEKLTFFYQGLDQRLTGTRGAVIAQALD
jgi:hypothetical protein